MSTIINSWSCDQVGSMMYATFICEVGYEEKDYNGITRYILPLHNYEHEVKNLPLPILKLNP